MVSSSKKRTYGQFCSVAKALDIVGDRWTLLLIRELMTGPKRYKDLLAALDGIGTNLLAARLKQLEAEGLLTKVTLPPPAGVEAYTLSPLGESLEPVYTALVRWGYRLLDHRNAKESWRAGWSVLTLKALFDASHAPDKTLAVVFRVGSEEFFGRIKNWTLDTGLGATESPDVIVSSDPDTFLDVALGYVDLNAAMASGQLNLEGDPELLLQFMACFPRPEDPARSPR